MLNDDNNKRDQGGKGGVPRNIVFSLLSLFVATPLNIIGMLLTARRLGKEIVGVSFSVFAIAIVVYILSGSGIATVLTRRIARELKDYRRHIAEATGMLILVCIVAFPLILGSGYVWSTAKGLPDAGWLFFLAAVAIAGRHVMEFAVGAFRGLERFEFETIIRMIQNGSFCAFAILYVSKERGAASAVSAFAWSHWLAAFAAVAILVVVFGCRRISLTGATIRDWLHEFWPLGWGDAIRGLGWHVDTILLSLLGTNAAVGLYNVAFRPLMPLRSLPRALASATFPMMSRLKDDPARVAQAFERSLNVLWFISLPICIAITGCAKHIVLLLTGPAFIEATRPLQIMIWITISLFITTQYRFLFTALDQQRLYSKMVTGILILKSICLACLIPFWGIYGAVFGSLISEMLLTLIGMEACRRMGVARVPWQRMARTIPPAIIMGAIAWAAADWTWPWTFPTVAASGILYVVLCIFCGVFDASELDRMKQLLANVMRRTGLVGATEPPKPSAIGHENNAVSVPKTTET